MSRLDPLREQIDACRPGSDDLSLRELAELAAAATADPAVAEELARSHAFDRQLTAALADVPVPAGLAERILDSLSCAAPAGPAAEAALFTAEAPERAAAGATQRLMRGSRLSRRRWIELGAGACAAAVLGALVVRFWPRTPRRIAPHELAQMAEAWLRQIQSPAGWSSDVAALPTALRPPTAVRAAPQRWRRFVTPEGWSSVAIDFAAPGSPRAVLLVVRSSARFAVPEMPLPKTRLPLSSAGPAAIAWQKGDLLYVLAVVEDAQRLDDFIVQPAVV
jgi:hypothetical protein